MCSEPYKKIKSLDLCHNGQHHDARSSWRRTAGDVCHLSSRDAISYEVCLLYLLKPQKDLCVCTANVRSKPRPAVKRRVWIVFSKPFKDVKNMFVDSVCKNLLRSLFGSKTVNLTAAWATWVEHLEHFGTSKIHTRVVWNLKEKRPLRRHTRREEDIVKINHKDEVMRQWRR